MTTIPPAGCAALLGDLRGERPPLYAALAARLRLLVGDGRLPVGARLPAERDLAAALHLSRATVAAAYGRLREQGWADARQGSGTWTRLPARTTGARRAARGCRRRPPRVWSTSPTPRRRRRRRCPPPSPRRSTTCPGCCPATATTPQGLPELRARIAERYARRGLPTTAEQVLVTTGALHAVGRSRSRP